MVLGGVPLTYARIPSVLYPVSYLKLIRSRVFISLTIQDSKKKFLPAHDVKYGILEGVFRVRKYESIT